MHLTGLLFPLAAVLVLTCTTNFMVAGDPPSGGPPPVDPLSKATPCKMDSQCEEATPVCLDSRYGFKCQERQGKDANCRTDNDCRSNKCQKIEAKDQFGSCLGAAEENGGGRGRQFPGILSRFLRALQTVKARFGGNDYDYS